MSSWRILVALVSLGINVIRRIIYMYTSLRYFCCQNLVPVQQQTAVTYCTVLCCHVWRSNIVCWKTLRRVLYLKNTPQQWYTRAIRRTRAYLIQVLFGVLGTRSRSLLLSFSIALETLLKPSFSCIFLSSLMFYVLHDVCHTISAATIIYMDIRILWGFLVLTLMIKILSYRNRRTKKENLILQDSCTFSWTYFKTVLGVPGSTDTGALCNTSYAQ